MYCCCAAGKRKRGQSQAILELLLECGNIWPHRGKPIRLESLSYVHLFGAAHMWYGEKYSFHFSCLQSYRKTIYSPGRIVISRLLKFSSGTILVSVSLVVIIRSVGLFIEICHLAK